MAPVLEMTDNGNNPVTTPEAPLVQLTEAGKEILRASRQNKIEQCQADFPTDDLSNEVQLEDAAEIIRVYNRADSRFITVENTMDDLKSCKQKSITKQYIDSKSLLTKDISNIKNKMEQFEKKIHR